MSIFHLNLSHLDFICPRFKDCVLSYNDRFIFAGSASIIRDQLLPFFTLKPFASFRDLNIVLIPEYDIKDGKIYQLYFLFSRIL